MGQFWKDAQSVFETATKAQQNDSADVLILVGAHGLRVVPGDGWSLDAALQHHGADAAYHVKRNGSSVVVNAKCGAAECELRGRTQRKAELFRDMKLYEVAPVRTLLAA